MSSRSREDTVAAIRSRSSVVLRTDDSRHLENALHSILALRGREYDGDGGAEWYLTTPEELVELYRVITGGQG